MPWVNHLSTPWDTTTEGTKMKLYIILALVGWAAAADYIIGGDDVTVAGKWPWQVSTDIIKNPHEVFLYFINNTGKWPWQVVTDIIKNPHDVFLYFY